MEKLNKSNLDSLYGGKKISKECEKLMKVIENNWEDWDKSTQDSAAQEWINKCSD